MITIGLDKQLMVWNLTASDGKPVLTHKCLLKKEPIQVMYCRRNQMIAFMDGHCSVGLIALDLAETGLER